MNLLERLRDETERNCFSARPGGFHDNASISLDRIEELVQAVMREHFTGEPGEPAAHLCDPSGKPLEIPCRVCIALNNLLAQVPEASRLL